MSNFLTHVSAVGIAEVIALGGWMVYRHPRRRTTYVFILNMLIIAAWLMTISRAFTSTRGPEAAYFIRLCSSIGTLLPMGFYLLFESILADGKAKLKRRMGLVWIGIGFLMMLYTHTNLYIKGATIVSGRIPEPIPGPLFALLGAYLVVGCSIVGITAYRNSFKVEGFSRIELQYLTLIGVYWVAIAGGLTLLPVILHDSSCIEFTLLPPAIMPFHVVYALTTRRVLDIPQTLAHMLAVLLTTVAMAGLAALCLLIGSNVAVEHAGFILGICAVGVSAYPTYRWILRFKESFVPAGITPETVQRIAQRVNQSAGARSTEGICRITAEELGTDLALLSGSAHEMQQVYPWSAAPIRLNAQGPLGHLIQEGDGKVLSRFSLERNRETDDAAKELRGLHMELVVPLKLNGQITGAMLVGHRNSKKPFSDDEQRALSLLGHQLALAADNSKLQDRMAQAARINTLGTIATGLAHEIYNPLVVIKSFSELLREDPSRENVDVFCKASPREIARIENLVNKLLQITRRQPKRPEKLPLTRPVDEALFLLKSQCQQANVIIDTEGIDKQAVVYGNLEDLREVFLNLILNALQANATNIILRIQAMPAVVRCSIRDNGSGIAEEAMPHVFEPFFTTRPEATGMGLTICSRLIGELHGTILINSRAQEGTEVTIELPQGDQVQPNPML